MICDACLSILGSRDNLRRWNAYDIEIVAEINHAVRLSDADFLAAAQSLARDGADVIDIGCEPGTTWNAVGERVRMLRDLGLRVSIDSMNVTEVSAAVKAGAELVLSVNSQNCQAAVDWGVEVIVVPDTPDQIDTMDRTIDYLANHQVRMRLDPILEPIGFGFAASLLRYQQTRVRYPDTELFMVLVTSLNSPTQIRRGSICCCWPSVKNGHPFGVDHASHQLGQKLGA